MMKFFLLIFLLPCLTVCNAQNAWDNTKDKDWPAGFRLTDIKSSSDGSVQKAIFYCSQKSINQPLIVSLHTWSGDFMQEDPLAKEVQLRDWNYIHPDFRGRNTNPDACGSDLVVADIEDAIRFAIQNGNVDPHEVHIIGVSGGGYATLLLFMKLSYPAKSFSAWASISGLEDWYWECKSRGLKYTTDLEGVTTKGKGFDPVEAHKRSPLFMPYSANKRKNASLHIFAGIHDGYTGSVPITHSFKMFNKLLVEMYPEEKNQRISENEQLLLLSQRTASNPDTCQLLGGRLIHLARGMPRLSLIVFEGCHEMIVPQALALIPVRGKKNVEKLNILAIGDSNAASDFGWPAQLKKLIPFSKVINKSISGNTIGFDNLGQEKLNTVKNIDQYLQEAYLELGQGEMLSYIFIGLGTNDAKQIFIEHQNEVPENLAVLVQKIKKWTNIHQKELAKIIIISPPPMDELKADIGKYGGGDLRIQKNNVQFRIVADKNQVDYLDIYTNMKTGIQEMTVDGVHLKEKAQFQIATEMMNYLKTRE